MGPREIPALSVLSLRAVGSPKCKADVTFAPTKDGKPSSASKLLRSFHNRPVLASGESMSDYIQRETKAIQELITEDNNNSSSDITVPTLERIPMKRTPAIGAGSGRRKQANDVDLNHPWVASYLPPGEEHEDESTFHDPSEDNDNIPTNPKEQTLVAESGSCALDLLQSYVDALVEMGRMDDNRLGLHFFAEYKANIELQYKASLPLDVDAPPSPAAAAPAAVEAPAPAPVALENMPIPKKKKRKRSGGGAVSAAKKKKEAEARAAAEAKRQAAILAAVPKSRASISLHNCEVLTETTSNLLTSRVLEHIHVLDLTGLQTLTDASLLPLVKSSGLQLERLSVKNCRRLTDASIHTVCEACPNLRAMDLGGCYNLQPRTLLDALAVKITRRGRGVFQSQALPHLVELHAGGIGPSGGWTDDLLPELFGLRGWKALTVGFSPYLTFAGWKEALLSVEQKHKEEHQEPQDGQEPAQLGDEGAMGDAATATATASNTSTKKVNTNMCQTLQSLGIAFCEQQLVDNAWLGLMGRHLPNLRALDVRGNHSLNSMTSWYDGRATISTSNTLTTKVHPKQSLVVLARYSGISANSIEETKRIYPLAAAPLQVSTESDGIGWGILRQEPGKQRSSSSSSQQDNYYKLHYQKRLAFAREAAAKQKEEASSQAAIANPTPEETATVPVVIVPPDDETKATVSAKEENSSNVPVAMETD